MFYSFPKDFQAVKPKPGITMYQINGNKMMISLAIKDADVDAISGKPHKHDSQENIMIVLKGEVSFSVGGETRICKARDAVIIPPGVMHSTDPGIGESEVLQIYCPPYE